MKKYTVYTDQQRVVLPVTGNRAININPSNVVSRMQGNDLIVESGRQRLVFANFPRSVARVLRRSRELSLLDIGSQQDLAQFDLSGMTRITVA